MMCQVLLTGLRLGLKGSEPGLDGAHLRLVDQDEWFTRAWTLRELLTPHSLEFIAAVGESFLGSKRDPSREISEITGIDEKYFWPSVYSIHAAGITTRLSWASRRNSTQGEDMAYCLMGLFDVNMPLLYGEGVAKVIPDERRFSGHLLIVQWRQVR